MGQRLGPKLGLEIPIYLNYPSLGSQSVQQWRKGQGEAHQELKKRALEHIRPHKAGGRRDRKGARDLLIS